MYEVEKKIIELTEEADFLLSCMKDENEFYKKHLKKDDYAKLIRLKGSLLKKLKHINEEAKKVENKEEFNKVYLKYKDAFLRIQVEFNNQRAKSIYNLAEKTYKNDGGFLIGNTIEKLQDIDNEKEKYAIEIFEKQINKDTGGHMTKKAKVNYMYQRILGELNVEHTAIVNFFSDEDISDEFSDLILDKIEEILGFDVKKVLGFKDKKDAKDKDNKNKLDLQLMAQKQAPITEITGYSMPLLQTDITNKIIGCHFKESDLKKTNSFIKASKDAIINNVTLQRDNIKMVIEASDIDKMKLDTKVHKTLIILMHELTKIMPYKRILDLQTAANYMQFTITLKDYMEARGLKDRTNAREQLKASLQILKKATISYKYKDKNDNERVGEIGVLDSWEFYNGKATIRVSPTFICHLSNSNLLMNYNKNLLTINDKKNPSSFNLGHELLVDARRNKNNKNRNVNGVFIINVKKLISVCDALTYDNRNFTSRIYDRFENDMDALVENKILKSWEFCNKGRKTLTNKELEQSKNYKDFLELYILYEPVNLD